MARSCLRRFASSYLHPSNLARGQAPAGGGGSVKRPIGYNDWRRVFQNELRSFGYHTFVAAKYEAIGRPLPDAARRKATYISRLRRIGKRLDAEHDAFTAEFAQAILDICRPSSGG